MACESSAVNFFLILPLRVDQADIFFGFKKLHLFCRARAICCRCGAMAALVCAARLEPLLLPGPITAPTALVISLANMPRSTRSFSQPGQALLPLRLIHF